MDDETTGEERAPGDRIADKYLLLRLLEIGGMGAIWVAHHLGLDIHVAIKFIRAESYSAVAAERLMQEARAAARIDHPAIVHVSDVGRTAGGDTYLVMELLDGEALCDVLAREARLDPITTARVLLPIAAGLAAMHGKKIVHRDVKPENIFLSCDDSGRWQPKLIDFGLARSPNRGARLTQRGFVVGTPVYMSPERMVGDDATDQDDVWSLAVVLYETITGVVPFDDPRAFTAPRSLMEHGCGDEELWEILACGLARRRQRYASAQALGKALAAWLWKQGGTDDITGVALRPTWLDDDDVRRLSSPRVSLVQTARFAAPFRSTGITSRAALARAAEEAAAAAGPPAPVAPEPSSPPTSTSRSGPAAALHGAPPSRSGRTAVLALSALAVTASAAGALIWTRSRGVGDPAAGTAIAATATASQVTLASAPGPVESADTPIPSSSASQATPMTSVTAATSATPRAPRPPRGPRDQGRLKKPPR